MAISSCVIKTLGSPGSPRTRAQVCSSEALAGRACYNIAWVFRTHDRQSRSSMRIDPMNVMANVSLTLAALVLLGNPAGAAEKLEYNRDIRPILAENCFACHGPDSAARKKGLRLDRRDDALASDAFVPG